MADSVDSLGVDLRTRVKKLGAKEKARRMKCRIGFSLTKKKKASQKSYLKVGVKKLLRAGMMPARTWGVHALGMAPTERLKLRRQMAAAGKKSTTSQQRKAWMRQNSSSSDVETGERTCKGNDCQTRDLGVKMPALAHIDFQR